jgi:hypothetical protein
MTDVSTYKHWQRYRKRWHRALEAVEQNEQLDVDADAAHRNLHMMTEQWTMRLHSLQGRHPNLWEERVFGEYTGLNAVYENELQVNICECERAEIELLRAVGKAIEEATVDLFDLPPTPPFVDPWTPDPAALDELIDDLEVDL